MTRNKKIALWVIVSVIIVAALIWSFFKFIKPGMDKKKEEARKKESQIVTNAQNTTEQPSTGKPRITTVAENIEMVGLGGTAVA